MGGHRVIKDYLPRGSRPLTVRFRTPEAEWRRRRWNEYDWMDNLLHGDARDTIIAARELREVILAAELRAVRRARQDGWSWWYIAMWAGLRTQSAYEKWARRLEPPSLRYPGRMSLDDLYREVILDHYRSPRNKRPLPEAEIDVHRNNPLCGDDITIHVAMRDGVAVDAAYEGQGCSISQASASMLTEQVKGKNLKEIEELVLHFRQMMAGEEGLSDEELGDLVALKGVVKYPVRIKCAVLAWDALQEGVSTAEA